MRAQRPKKLSRESCLSPMRSLPSRGDLGTGASRSNAITVHHDLSPLFAGWARLDESSGALSQLSQLNCIFAQTKSINAWPIALRTEVRFRGKLSFNSGTGATPNQKTKSPSLPLPLGGGCPADHFKRGSPFLTFGEHFQRVHAMFQIILA